MLEWNKGKSLYDFLYENDTTSLEYLNKNLKQTTLFFKRKNILNYHPVRNQENTSLDAFKSEASQYIVNSGSTTARYKIKNTTKYTVSFYFISFGNNTLKNINALLLFSDLLKLIIYFKHNSLYYYLMLDKRNAKCNYIIANKNILHEAFIDNKYVNLNFVVEDLYNRKYSKKLPEKFSTDYTVEGYDYIAIEKTSFFQQKIIMTEKMQDLLTEISNIFDFTYTPTDEFLYIDDSDIIEIYKNDMASSGIKLLHKIKSKYYLLDFPDRIVLQKNILSEHLSDSYYTTAYFIDTTDNIINDNNKCEYYVDVSEYDLNSFIDKFEIIDATNLYELNGKIYIKANSIINTNYIIDSANNILNSYYTANDNVEIIKDNDILKLRFINNTNDDIELTNFGILPYFSKNNYVNTKKYKIFDFTSEDININNVILLPEPNNIYSYDYFKFDEALNSIQPIYATTKADATYNDISFEINIFPKYVKFTGLLKVIYLSNTDDYYFEVY